MAFAISSGILLTPYQYRDTKRTSCPLPFFCHDIVGTPWYYQQLSFITSQLKDPRTPG
jgi:hypothetical protein